MALGGLLGLGLWLVWQMALALLAVKAVVAEVWLAPAQWAGAFLAAFAGGRFAVRRSGLGTLPSALGAAAALLGMSVLLGFLLFGELGLDGQGLRLLCAMAAGGAAAGLLLLGGKRRRKGKGRKAKR